MNKHRWQLLGVVLLVLAFVAGVAVEPSFAGPSKIGENAGDEVESWAKALILPIAALVGLPLLLRRDFAQALMLFCLVMVIGSFIYAPSVVRGITTSIAKALGG